MSILPFSVLVLHPNKGFEMLIIGASDNQQALLGAARICAQRSQWESQAIIALSLSEIQNLEKLLQRASFIGPEHGISIPKNKQNQSVSAKNLSQLNDLDHLDQNVFSLNIFNSKKDIKEDVNLDDFYDDNGIKNERR